RYRPLEYVLAISGLGARRDAMASRSRLDPGGAGCFRVPREKGDWVLHRLVHHSSDPSAAALPPRRGILPHPPHHRTRHASRAGLSHSVAIHNNLEDRLDNIIADLFEPVACDPAGR